MDNYEQFITARTKMIYTRFDRLNIELSQSEDNMDSISAHLTTIGKTNSIDELNASYNAIVLSAESLSFDGITSRSEVERTLNHLTNYNIVRIANRASEDYEASGQTDKSRLIEISRCRDSIKPHEDNQTEIDLLDNLCDQLEIR